MSLTVGDSEAGDRLGVLAALLAEVKLAWHQATQEQRNRLARLIFEEVVISDAQVVEVKPRPELAGFFVLDRQVRAEEVTTDESDEESTTRVRYEMAMDSLVSHCSPLLPLPERISTTRTRLSAPTQSTKT